MREKGFYWVKSGPVWVVAEWCVWMIAEYLQTYWRLAGRSQRFEDADFAEIDEVRLTRHR